jgi:hypothetical protein
MCMDGLGQTNAALGGGQIGSTCSVFTVNVEGGLVQMQMERLVLLANGTVCCIFFRQSMH